ncbi:MAG: asparaginase [Bacillota bacterium]
MNESTKKVILLTTGGTIASIKNLETGYIQSGVVTGDDLAKLIPGEKNLAFELHELFQLPSGHLTFTHLKELAETVAGLLEDKAAAGMVITHGTDTLEETAYFLDLVVDKGKPVVLTGSQKPPGAMASDALSNLTDAMQVALCEESSVKGVLVVFNGKIFAASEVIKVHTSNPDAFVSPGWGPLGYLDEDQVIYRRHPKKTSKLSLGVFEKKVYLIKFALGMDGGLVKMALDAGADGLVLEGFGRGQIPPDAVKPVAEAVSRGIPVVLTTRCLEGAVKGVYDYHGSGHHLEKLGVILAGDLPALKARMKLMVLLSSGMSFDSIKELFSGSLLCGS